MNRKMANWFSHTNLQFAATPANTVTLNGVSYLMVIRGSLWAFISELRSLCEKGDRGIFGSFFI